MQCQILFGPNDAWKLAKAKNDISDQSCLLSSSSAATVVRKLDLASFTGVTPILDGHAGFRNSLGDFYSHRLYLMHPKLH